MTNRRTVSLLAGPGVQAARDIYTGCPVDALRVAALVDIAGAAAALARTVVKLRHLDPAALATQVADPADLRAVLGRGRWLPTMTRHVIGPPAGNPPVFPLAVLAPAPAASRRARPVGNPDQLTLFPYTAVHGAGVS